MNLAALTPKQYDALKRDLRPYIKAAVYYSDETVKGVEKRIQERTALPIVMTEDYMPIGLMVLELEPDAVHVTTLAGDFQKDWKEEVFTALVSIAKGRKKHRIQLKGRKGWTRVLDKLGFKPVENGYLEAVI